MWLNGDDDFIFFAIQLIIYKIIIEQPWLYPSDDDDDDDDARKSILYTLHMVFAIDV